MSLCDCLELGCPECNPPRGTVGGCTPYCSGPCALACEPCPGCHHLWGDHDERDGCGACAMAMTGPCKRRPIPDPDPWRC